MTREEALTVLGLSSEANLTDIKRAYKRLAKEHHPDVQKGKINEDRFKQINEAHQILTGKAGPGPAVFNDPFGFDKFYQEFSAVFGGDPGFGRYFKARTFKRSGSEASFPQQPRPGISPIVLEPVRLATLGLDFEQALFRKEIKVKLAVKACCERCLGTPDLWTACKNCKQTGIQNTMMRTPIGLVGDTRDCPLCDGRGWIAKEPCTVCSGKLVYQKVKIVSFRPPADLQSGLQVVVPKQGSESWLADWSDILITLRFNLPDASGLTEEDRTTMEGLLVKLRQPMQ